MNVPCDWNTYREICCECGAEYHASEGGCYCVDRRAEMFAAEISREIPRFFDHLEVELPVVELSSELAKKLGYLNQETPPTAYQRTLQGLFISGIRRAARRCGVGVEIWVRDDECGDSWTIEIVEGD